MQASMPRQFKQKFGKNTRVVFSNSGFGWLTSAWSTLGSGGGFDASTALA